jgi:hypothetical protein
LVKPETVEPGDEVETPMLHDDLDEPVEGESVEVPVWGAPSASAATPPTCPNGHGPMAESQYGGYWCRTCKAKVKD